MMRQGAWLGFLCTSCALACIVACAPSEPVAVTHAWIRAPAPGASVAAGYFDIVNRRDTPKVLTGARSSASPRIEMHTTEGDGDLMQMRQLERVELPPRAKVSFSENGRHLMMMQFSGVTTGAVPVTLLFADGSELTVPFELRSITGAAQP
jgi:copper(I)-binding protein